MKRLLLSIITWPFTLLTLIVGRLVWTAPNWLLNGNKLRQQQPWLSGFCMLAVVLLFAAYHFIQNQPKPILVKAEVSAPNITANYEGAEPDKLIVRFNYDFSNLKDEQERPSHSPSVARIDLVGEKAGEGISMKPSVEGVWFWIDDRTLQFTPTQDWPPATEYDIRFKQMLFTPETRLSKAKQKFTTPAFTADIKRLEFYQDPTDISIRRAISTIEFSHPVNSSEFEAHVLLGMRPSGAGINSPLEDYGFSITYSKNHREAYLQSNPISLPDKENYMHLRLTAGFSSLLGKETSKSDVTNKVGIPDRFSFLKITSAQSLIVRNKKNQPEQFVILEFTDEIEAKALIDKMTAYLLPEKWRKTFGAGNNRAVSVTAKILKQSQKVTLTAKPTLRSHSKNFSFPIDLPENRDLYIKLERGLTSVNNFEYNNTYNAILKTPAYPKEVDIAGDGSILTYSGGHQLSVLVRGVDSLRYSVGRLLHGEINHLVSQTYGDISNPSFSNWNFDAENLAEFDTQIVSLSKHHPKQENYSSLNLSEYLPYKKSKLGLFFVKVEAWDEKHNRPIYNTQDQRLILITDLGLIIKNNLDQSHDFFVQSIHTGNPVEGASVTLLGKNGMALFTQKTDTRGHVKFPSASSFKNEKAPVVYVVKTNNDISFIPYNRSSRQINLSKFDIGGVSTPRSSGDGSQGLNGFGFSDRGIYRPSDDVNLGFIVKHFDLRNIEGVPLKLIIKGPRNNTVDSKVIELPKMGFLDYTFKTETTSDTGRYQASLHIVNKRQRLGRQIGSTSFKVEEFQPDTLKIVSELVGLEKQAWTTATALTANITLNNLFGTPAQDRRTEGRMIVQPAHFYFEEFKGYTFTPTQLNSEHPPLSINERLNTQKTDADGKAQFKLDLDRFRDGTYRLQFISEGFDQAGGRSVSSSNSTLISPLDTLVGFKADGKLGYINAKSRRSLNFIAINSHLKKVAQSKLSLRKIEIQHVSTLVKQPNGTYQYQTIDKETALNTEDFTIDESGREYTIDTTQAGDFALELYDDQQHKLARVEYTVVGFANLAGKLDKNAELQVKLNKADYKAGELIEMNIRAPYTGAGLITIETDKVHTFKWFKTSTESSLQTIKLPDNIEGTGYVNIAFVRDVGSKEVFTSPLSYAVQPFSIDKSKRKISIDLDIAKIVRPGKAMKIGFRADRNSKIAIFAVDEGILQVAKYVNPQPLKHFLKKRALEVSTLQILDLILPDFKLLKELSATGGGSLAKRKALSKNLNPFARKTDAPAVYWSGIVDAGEKQQTVTFDVPETFSGSLRVMAVAVSEDAFGSISDSTTVRGPFVISPNVLTQTAPDDEFLVTVGVANIIEGSGKGAEVSIDISSSKHLKVLDANTRKLIIDEGSEGEVTFRVLATKNLGAASLTFKVKHKDIEAQRTATLSVRPAMPYRSTLMSGYNKSGSKTLKLPRQLYPNLSKQKISASTSPLVLVDGLKDYLEHYPHGCTEQVVSKVFPLIGLMSHPHFSSNNERVTAYFDRVVLQLRQRQQGEGGFSFWPGGSAIAAYPTIYATHFLVEAKEQGFNVPSEMLSRAMHYIRTYASKQIHSIEEARIRANAIYLLSRYGEVSTNYLVDLHETLEAEYKNIWHKDLTASYIAASYMLLKKDDEARSLISPYKMGQKQAGQYDDFHSPLAQDAQHLYLLAKHFPHELKAITSKQVLTFTQPLFKGQYNTISAAYSILALGSYSQVVFDKNVEQAISFAVRTDLADEGQSEYARLDTLASPFPSASYQSNVTNVKLSAQKPQYYLNTQSGFDSSLPSKSIRQGLEIHRDFLDDSGNKITEFKQGEEVTVRLRVRTLDGKRLFNIAVIDLLPGGFEVVRSSVSKKAYNWQADYVDIREDRVIYYGTFDSTVRDLVYKVKLSAAGSFVVPPSFAESMYNRDLRAMSEAGTFTVLPADL